MKYMGRDYIPVLVEIEEKIELWQLDVTNLSVTDLIKLKEELIKEPYSKTIRILDALIMEDVRTISSSNHINNYSYMRTYKKSKKEAKQRKKTKSRRIDYDKYKR